MGEPQEEQIQDAVRQMQQMKAHAPQSEAKEPPPQSEAKNPPPQASPPALPPQQESHPASGLLQFLHLDSDALLILPLILLLMREGADDKLVLALLYVLL